MNRSVIRNVVPIIAQWRWVKREKPDGGNPQFLQIVESLREAGEIPDAVSIAVAESAYMKLINNGIFVPETIPLQRQRSTLLSVLRNHLSVIPLSYSLYWPHSECIGGNGQRIQLDVVSDSTPKVSRILWQVMYFEPTRSRFCPNCKKRVYITQEVCLSGSGNPRKRESVAVDLVPSGVAGCSTWSRLIQ